MSSSISSSDLARDPTTKTAAKGARLFLGTLAAGAVLGVVGFTVMDESYLHAGGEFGMAEALEDHIQEACKNKITPDILIIGDSRAVAGVSVNDINAAGGKAEKFAVGAAGVFAGWATLDRLLDCGVRPKAVLMGYGVIHLIDSGAIMERTTSYDALKGPRAAHQYEMLSQWEHRPMRQATYKAVSMFGTELTGVDFTLLSPALKSVLEKPATLVENHDLSERVRREFRASNGDRFYGTAESNNEMPQEAGIDFDVLPVNLKAAEAIGQLSKQYGFNVMFYILPSSQAAADGMDPRIFDMARGYRGQLASFGIQPLNDIWVLPNSDFGDPGHVNSRGRVEVTRDLLPRLGLPAASKAREPAP